MRTLLILKIFLFCLMIGVSLSAQDEGVLHKKAEEHHKKREYEKALEVYKEILEKFPDDTIALYNSACAYSLLKNKEKAVEFLKKAVEAGFVDFSHIESDEDLNEIRETEGYKEIMEKKAEYLKSAADKRVEKLKAKLGDKYKIVRDEERKLIIVSDLEEETLNQYMNILKRWEDALHKEFFENLPQTYIFVLIPSSTKEYRERFGGSSAAGFYNYASRTLTVNIETGTGTMVHEFAHALHHADMEALKQQHPIWIVEAFGSLFEQCTIKEDRPVGLLNWRLPIIKEAISDNSHFPLKEFVTKSSEAFNKNMSLAYAQARYIFYYLQEKNLLKDFYRKYVKGYSEEKTGLKVLEELVGKKLEEFEKEWKEFVSKLEYETSSTPRRPKLGVRLDEEGGSLKVVGVEKGSGAEAAGLKEGDIILEADGRKISAISDLQAILGSKKSGDKVKLKIKRGDEELELEATLK
ncbi:MAG: PDZ domain-containing protein [Planctomycetota bacterium]|nr:PDZ domain-containing protein [Planctomycetota bacterium]